VLYLPNKNPNKRILNFCLLPFLLDVSQYFCPANIISLYIINKPLNVINPLKPKYAYIIFKNSVRTSERTPHYNTTDINWLMLFKDIITVYNENHTKSINTKCSVTYC
jgi:hypothetical protein